MISKSTKPFLLTLVILSLLEILVTSILPIFGLEQFKLPFHVVVILYLCFKIENLYLPIMIILVEFVHGFFSIEGWEIGTVCGVMIYFLILFLKDLINLTSSIMIIFLVGIFQLMWFLFSSILYYIQLGDFQYLFQRFWNFLPESLLVSICAPLLFTLLDVIWSRVRKDGIGDGL